MKISTKGLYAVRLMLYLAEHDGGGPVSLKEVSESLGISKKYLEQIVSNVVTAKLVRSVRGAAGGYQRDHRVGRASGHRGLACAGVVLGR